MQKSTFVEFEDGRDGVAKLVAVEGELAEVEYFESPAGPTLRRVQSPIDLLKVIELSPQTRVFWFDPAHDGWRAGRVDVGLISAEALGKKEDHYLVRFPNGVDATVPISDLHVRWSHPISDPTDYLAARVTDTPRFFDGRSRIVGFFADQRAGFGGLSGLASAGIELLEHQIAIVRRVLADPVQRYLLADEVGLGKTIEAGVLIRQHLIDDPDSARVLVITPSHLVGQWQAELETKFFLGASWPAISVVSEEDAPALDVSAGWTMLVVDEAQRPALNAFATEPSRRRVYDALRSLAARVPRVLLLSGTPVLKQEDGFLAMLHLLDPVGYPLDDRHAFTERVRSRQTIAEALLDLTDDASEYFAADALVRLEPFFERDSRLESLCTRVRALLSLDTDTADRIDALRALRVHLGETYRLHRRLLRTRRDDPRVQSYLPKRNGLTLIEHADEAREEAFDLLERWRIAVLPSILEGARDMYVAMFSDWVTAGLSHPTVLLRAIDDRIASLRRGNADAAAAFDGEENFLRERRTLLAQAAAVDRRAETLARWLRSNSEIKKVIVFVDDSAVADAVTRVLCGSFGTEAIVRHDGSPDAVRRFESRRPRGVLVCDRTAEEGLNLQRYGATLVHLDLPLEPARLEQRIGRIDRLEARGQIKNVALSTACPYESQWLACLQKAVRVFDRSVAPLQYALVESSSRVRSLLIEEGPSAFERESALLLDPHVGLDAELRRIRAQEAIDAVEGDAEGEAAFFQSMCEADEAVEVAGPQALNAWVVDQLLFRCQRVDADIVQYVHDLRRPTLVPIHESYRLFRRCIDRSGRAPRERTALPMEPATFARAVSETRHVGLLRIGHPFVDAMEALVRSDDRGAAFAMWRYVPRSVRVPRLYLRFNFVIEADLSALPDSFAQHVSMASLRRRIDQAFPLQYRTLWLNGDLEVVKNPRALEVLQRPYRKDRQQDGSYDLNLRHERWLAVDRSVPVPDWGDLCRRGRRAAEAFLTKDSSLVDTCRRHAAVTLEAATRVDEALKSRIARLSGASRVAEERAARIEMEVGRGLAKGIERPSFRVDSAGAVFLASQPLDGV
jgi:ATP-dependent helicase HepA